MNEFVLVLGMAMIAAVPIFLAGCSRKRRFAAPCAQRGAAVRGGDPYRYRRVHPVAAGDSIGPPLLVVLAFFAGGSIFVAMEYLAARSESPKPTKRHDSHSDSSSES